MPWSILCLRGCWCSPEILSRLQIRSQCSSCSEWFVVFLRWRARWGQGRPDIEWGFWPLVIWTSPSTATSLPQFWPSSCFDLDLHLDPTHSCLDWSRFLQWEMSWPLNRPKSPTSIGFWRNVGRTPVHFSIDLDVPRCWIVGIKVAASDWNSLPARCRHSLLWNCPCWAVWCLRLGTSAPEYHDGMFPYVSRSPTCWSKTLISFDLSFAAVCCSCYFCQGTSHSSLRSV